MVRFYCRLVVDFGIPAEERVKLELLVLTIGNTGF